MLNENDLTHISWDIANAGFAYIHKSDLPRVKRYLGTNGFTYSECSSPEYIRVDSKIDQMFAGKLVKVMR